MRCNDVPAAPEMMCRLRGNTAEKLFELEQSRAACGLPDFVFSWRGCLRRTNSLWFIFVPRIAAKRRIICSANIIAQRIILRSKYHL